MAEITKATYRRLFTIASYENEVIGFEADLSDDDDPEAVVLQLAQMAAQYQHNVRCHFGERHTAYLDVVDLEAKRQVLTNEIQDIYQRATMTLRTHNPEALRQDTDNTDDVGDEDENDDDISSDF